MAKKAIPTVTSQRPTIGCREFRGYLDEMSQEAKDALIARNPKAAKLFENK